MSNKEDHIVPSSSCSSSSHSSIKTAATTVTATATATAGSGWIENAPWSNMSLEQLSSYARRASSSSLNLFNVLPTNSSNSNNRGNRAEDTEQRMIDRIQKVQRGSLRTLKLSLNDSSQGLYRISEHIHRRVPQIVEQQQQLATLSEQVKTAHSDLEDAREAVTNMERIESFAHIGDMIQHCLVLTGKLK